MYGEKQLRVPATIKSMAVNEFKLTEYAPLFDNLPQGKTDRDIRTMEEYNQGYGSILYRTELPELKTKTLLTVNEAHDFAQVFVDGKYIGKLDRRNGEKELMLPPCNNGAVLDILVEAMGRINFGRAIKDFKGITDKVTITEERGGHAFVCDLKNWTVFNIEDTPEYYNSAKFKPIADAKKNNGGRLPRGIYRGKFNVQKTNDTFLNFETWGKGLVYVNGHPIGRIWEIGPQQTLYMPGCWLKKGENEIVVLDIVGPREPKAEGLSRPVLDKLQLLKKKTHRNENEKLDLTGESPAITGAFKTGNGWQEMKTDVPRRGRYVCIEAVDALDSGDIVSIAEFYVLGKNGERLSREPWTVIYADSEETGKGNHSADKIFDLQESTYWSSETGSKYPHHIVIDLGSVQDISGIQYLPRMENNVPGGIKNFKFYIKESVPFKY